MDWLSDGGLPTLRRPTKNIFDLRAEGRRRASCGKGNRMKTSKSTRSENPDGKKHAIADRASAGRSCDTSDCSGPPTEAGGTTGAGNASMNQASRTGGATGGVAPGGNTPAKSRNGIKPSA